MATQETFALTNSAGTSINLSAAPYRLMAHDGLGLVSPARAVQQGPYQHGGTLLSARLVPRTITLKIAVKSTTEALMRAGTEALERLCNRLDIPLYLDVTRPDGSVRRLDVYHNSGFALPRTAGEHLSATIDVIQLVADNPIAYTPALTTTTLAVGGSASAGWEMDTTPTSVDGWFLDSGGGAVDGWYMGASVIDVHLIITYTGTWPAYPLIRVVGPIADPIITNDTTGDKLDFTGFTLGAGEYIDIDCRYGYKTVTEDDGSNRLGNLTADSDLATWRLVPADEALGGLNDIHIEGTGATGATVVYMTYHTQWISAL